MKILITGGAGFIGSHIADAYVSAGHDVVIVDDLTTGREEFVPKGARFIKMDITSPEIDELFEREKFQVVNHHAAHMELRVSVDKPLHDAEVNILGSVRLLEAARRTHVHHCVLASSVAVLGNFLTIPADETHPTRPISPYGVSKLAMEHYAEYFRTSHAMRITVFRYTNVYGPRQNPFGESGVVGIFLNKFLSGSVATIHGDGEQLRDYLYVSDVVRAILIATERSLNGTFMLCANSETSVNEVVRLLHEHIHAKDASFPCEVENGPPKVGDPPITRGSFARFSALTGWKPATGIDQGIAETTAWFLNRR